MYVDQPTQIHLKYVVPANAYLDQFFKPQLMM